MDRQPSARSTTADALRARLTDRLVEHLGVTSIRLWRVTAEGERIVHTIGDGPFDVAIPIRSRGRTVARLEVDRADARHDDVLERISLWLVLVLDALEEQRVGLASDRVGEAAAAWNLTPAQTRVLQQIALGRGAPEIAESLGLPPRAVEIHVGRILRVTGAASPREVVARLSAIVSSGNPAFARAPGGANRAGDSAPLSPQQSSNREG